MIKVTGVAINSGGIKRGLCEGKDPKADTYINIRVNADALKALRYAVQNEIEQAAKNSNFKAVIKLAETLEDILYTEEKFEETVTSVKEELKEEAKEAEEGETAE